MIRESSIAKRTILDSKCSSIANEADFSLFKMFLAYGLHKKDRTNYDSVSRLVVSIDFALIHSRRRCKEVQESGRRVGSDRGDFGGPASYNGCLN